ncbi:di-heme oxidoredictase family protein [Fulvimarina sp. 2208YS6-2-32]|uniref:Di-heme oxidoredictase family protein n=1 Tax=Fulvimarina uroteuthidis TaxID=3098149 RepID=A0ABU5I0R8_9HYPH|nr:di-heme oxidoredictase family protein [Fulvimarina sp. 2208YS6-2-32]MDY8108973.1 di-heme oxidoredictase family protein [Fulvimarina sp. 2208YS6-2-32]
MVSCRALAFASLSLTTLLALPLAAALGERQAVRGDLTKADLDRVRRVTAPTSDFTQPERFEAMQGGAATFGKVPNQDAFSQVSANQSFAGEDRFKLGNALFRKFWVSSPSSTIASDGLGPLYNARACQSCHLKDGRGRPPAEGEEAVSMFLRLSVPPKTREERQALADRTLTRIAEPTYGGQLQNFAVPGYEPEGRMVISYEEMDVALSDGTAVSLRKPTYSVADLNYGPMADDVMLSPRIANPMIGLGLVEAIEEADIRALADPDDRDGNGISGKVSEAIDPETGALRLARFGWKATTPSIKVQSAEAFSGDIGISTPLKTDAFGECSNLQDACRTAPSGVQARLGKVEAPDPVLGLVTFYSQNLAVPARRDVGDETVLAGKEAFYEAGCAACHQPKFVTSRKAEDEAQRFQLIWPYSDFLLHDMGEGLADGRPVGDASGREWRTQPLWGIGLTDVVNGNTFYLHDGRARTLEEAILWHGGEAENARNAYASFDAATRKALITFLESL